MKVLWLASWYPNKYEPYNGDFIQRHAQAVAAILPLDVIHVLQAGCGFEIEKTELTLTEKNGLREYIYIFAFKPIGIEWIDKIRYNILYHKCCRKAVKNYFKQVGKPSVIHVHVPVKAGLTANYILKKYGIPFIVSEQSSHYETSSPYYFLKRTKYFQKNTARIFKNAIAVTNVSDTIGKKLYSFFEIKNYRTIHNLVDTGLFYYKPKTGTAKLQLLHVSALGEQKNPSGIIEALALIKHTSWICTICGPCSEKLKLEVIENGLRDNIKFTGEISYAQVAAEMQKADLFILFSNHENFPCVVVEALCCGLPVIATNVGGIKEAVNESNGLLITPGNVEDLAAAIDTLIVNIKNYNPENIAASASALYNKKRIAGQFLTLYKEIIQKNIGD